MNQEMELSAICNLLSIVLNSINEIPSTLEQIVMETWRSITAWLLRKKIAAPGPLSQLTIVLEITLFLVWMMKLCTSLSKHWSQELELDKGCEGIAYTLEIGCRSKESPEHPRH